ncbi:hypothetical protein Bca52824_004277 [Brassica carinata]|uniref:Uncharacterized protein n=1 Tax=Brassica carinata TaxID=52824 RepID=A0A8X8BFE2_BRACI|nr:hypothetical protein Bca52824_004277 [Brassica carinata]
MKWVNLVFKSLYGKSFTPLDMASILTVEINLNEYMQCYCGVCDKPAPCAQWMPSHCNASADSFERKSPTLESESFYYSD